MNKRRLLVAACAALTLALACVTGELRAGAANDEGGDVVSASDTIEALPPVAGLELSPPPSSGCVFVDLSFPTSRLATADVFRPPRA